MNHTWGVYEVRGRLAGGAECAPNDKKAVAYFVRWRVDGTKRRRSFRTKSHAQTFRDLLLKAKLLGWPADERGWPIDPQGPAPGRVTTGEPAAPKGRTIEQYIDDVWWPTISVTLADKSRLGHRRNADLAIDLLRLREGGSAARIGDIGSASMCVDAGRMCTMPKAFPKEFREDVIRVYRDSDASLAQVAKDFGISPSCLKRWITIDDRNSATPSSAGRAANESDALREANKRIKLLEQENEVLRRAAAYLSQANLPGK